MSDDFSYSYSINPGAPQAPAEPPGSGDPALYAFDECEALPIPGATLLVNRATGARLALMPEVAQALQHCAVFRTLDEHAAILVSRIPQLQGETADVLRVLILVRDAGLLLSSEEVCQRANRDPLELTEAPAPSAVCITSCDRPEALARLLDSMMRGAALARHSAYYLVDDSRQPENRARNRELVQNFSQTSPVLMHYVGASEQAAIVDSLVRQLPEAERGIRFALDRELWHELPSYGLARNFCLLLTVGYRCIVLDDDVLCTALRTPLEEPGVRVGDGLRDVAFFREQSLWEQTAQSADFDPLEGHKRCLGLPLGRAMGQLASGPMEADQLRGALGSQFRTMHADSRVLVTQCGSFGDPGTDGNAWLVNLEPESRDRMLRAVGLQGALEERQCWIGQMAPRLSRRAVMSQMTGLDNSALLPPYFPVFRGEDQLFGAMLAALHPQALVLEYSWGVPHLPLEVRRGNPAGDSTVPAAGLRLLASLVTDSGPDDSGMSVHTRLSHLAQLFEELAEGSDEHLNALYVARMTRAQAVTIQNFGDQLRISGDTPQEWQQYLQRCMEDNSAAAQAPLSLAELPGLPPEMDGAAVAGAAREFAGGFANLLRHWAQLRQCAAGVAAQQFA